MRRQAIEEQNRYMLKRQHEFRMAADVVTDAFMRFEEVEAVAVIGSVAKPLWKEVPRFAEFRRAGIEVWHECKDLDLAVWLSSFDRLEKLRRKRDTCLRDAYAAGTGPSVANHQVEVFLFEPGTDRHLGRLCNFNACPKHKPDCAVPVAARGRLLGWSRGLSHMPICSRRRLTRHFIGEGRPGASPRWICLCPKRQMGSLSEKSAFRLGIVADGSNCDVGR